MALRGHLVAGRTLTIRGHRVVEQAGAQHDLDFVDGRVQARAIVVVVVCPSVHVVHVVAAAAHGSLELLVVGQVASVVVCVVVVVVVAGAGGCVVELRI